MQIDLGGSRTLDHGRPYDLHCANRRDSSSRPSGGHATGSLATARKTIQRALRGWRRLVRDLLDTAIFNVSTRPREIMLEGCLITDAASPRTSTHISSLIGGRRRRVGGLAWHRDAKAIVERLRRPNRLEDVGRCSRRCRIRDQAPLNMISRGECSR